MRFAPAPRVPGVPHPRAGRSSPTRRSCARRARRGRWSRRSRPRWSSPTSSRWPPALAGELAGVPVATLVPHVFPTAAPGFPPYALGARLPAHAARARAVARAATRPVRRGRARARGAQRDAPRGSACRRSSGCTAGSSRPARARGDVPPARVPARAGRPACTSSGRCCGSRRSSDVEPPPGDEPLVLVAPSTSQDPRAAHAARRARGAGARAGARARDLEPAPAAAAARGARRTPAGRVDLLRADDAALRVVVCHAGHGTLVRALASGVPRSWRARPPATWARTRRGWTGPASACGCRGGW